MSRQLAFAATVALALMGVFVLASASGDVAGGVPQAALAFVPFAGR